MKIFFFFFLLGKIQRRLHIDVHNWGLSGCFLQWSFTVVVVVVECHFSLLLCFLLQPMLYITYSFDCRLITERVLFLFILKTYIVCCSSWRTTVAKLLHYGISTSLCLIEQERKKERKNELDLKKKRPNISNWSTALLVRCSL